MGDPELQWGTTTAARELNARWRAPEVLGIGSGEVTCPTFMSDIYSLGCVIFFVQSLLSFCGPILIFIDLDYLGG